MRTVVLRQINQLDGLFDAPQGRIRHRGRRPNEGEHGAVVIRIGFAIEQRHFGHRRDRRNDGLHLGRVAAFGKIRNALYELSGHTL